VVKWILFFSELLILSLVFWTSKWDGTFKQHRLFSITLPADVIQKKALTQVQKYFQKQLSLSFIIIVSLSILCLFLQFQYVSLEMLIFFFIIFSAIGLPSYFYAQANRQVKQIKVEQNWQAGTFSHGIHEDDFWKYGQFYNNPHDVARSVSKRMGIGTTLNLAHKSQRRFLIGSIVVTLMVTVVLSFGLFYMEVKSPNFRIESKMLYIDYPIYYYKLPLEQVNNLTVLQILPSISKENGIGTESFARGYYYVEGYGRVFLCVYNKGPFILIDTKQGKLIINESTEETTFELLEALDIVIPK
jgi:uncharacterized membrane protein